MKKTISISSNRISMTLVAILWMSFSFNSSAQICYGLNVENIEKKAVVKKQKEAIAKKQPLPKNITTPISFVIEDDIMQKEGSTEENPIVEENIEQNTLKMISSQKNTKIRKRKAINKSINIYPIPASQYINIQLESDNVKEIQLMNYSGQVVINQQVTNNNLIRFNVQNLAKGIYIVVLRTETENISKSIIIQ